MQHLCNFLALMVPTLFVVMNFITADLDSIFHNAKSSKRVNGPCLHLVI
jgi:hypothetical protein